MLQKYPFLLLDEKIKIKQKDNRNHFDPLAQKQKGEFMSFFFNWIRRDWRGSNPQLPPWQGGALTDWTTIPAILNTNMIYWTLTYSSTRCERNPSYSTEKERLWTQTRLKGVHRLSPFHCTFMSQPSLIRNWDCRVNLLLIRNWDCRVNLLLSGFEWSPDGKGLVGFNCLLK